MLAGQLLRQWDDELIGKSEGILRENIRTYTCSGERHLIPPIDRVTTPPNEYVMMCQLNVACHLQSLLSQMDKSRCGTIGWDNGNDILTLSDPYYDLSFSVNSGTFSKRSPTKPTSAT